MSFSTDLGLLVGSSNCESAVGTCSHRPVHTHAANLITSYRLLQNTAAALNPPTYSAANIVPNIQTGENLSWLVQPATAVAAAAKLPLISIHADCPVKNVPFNKTVFDGE